MTRSLLASLLVLALAAAAPAAVLAGCGSDDDEEEEALVEGEPVEVGGLSYNVQLTRFLNPGDPEDAAYLAGEPPAPRGKVYLGVFMVVENEGSEPARVPYEMTVSDTRKLGYTPERSRSEYALDFGEPLAPEETLPEPGTTAAAGPIKGAMVLFLVPQDMTENRPVELAIPGKGGEFGLVYGKVELDI